MATAPNPQISEVVSASVDGWCLFVTTGLNSDFYREISQLLEPETAAQVTMIYFYLSTFTKAEQDKMMSDVDFFLRYADGFVRELLPYGKRDLNFLIESRRVFQRAMRRILSRDYDSISEAISYQERRNFLRGALRLTASVDSIIAAWDRYREFLYRKKALLPASVAAF